MAELVVEWKLRAIAPKDTPDWQDQYTGFDPGLALPEQLDNDLARAFLLSYARYEDTVTELNALPFRDKPANKTAQYLRGLDKNIKDAAISGIVKRAAYNTPVISTTDPGRFLRSYIVDYLFAKGDASPSQNIFPTPSGCAHHSSLPETRK